VLFVAEDDSGRMTWNSTKVVKELKTRIGRLEFRLAQINQENVGPRKGFLHAADVRWALASKREAFTQSPAECYA